MKARLPWQGTTVQKKAMLAEIDRQILERDARFTNDFDAMVLWTLHVCFGFGKKRLRRFFNAFTKEHERLREYYQMNDDEIPWLCDYKLKNECDIDVSVWNEEKK